MRNLLIKSSALLKIWYIKSLLGTLIVLLFVGSVTVTLPSPSTMVSLDSHTETIDIDIVNRDAAEIHLPVAWNEQVSRCEKNLTLTPTADSTAQYARSIGGALYVNLIGNWDISADGKPDYQSEQYVSYRIGGDDICGIPNRVRLPAIGYISVGSENLAAPDAGTLVTLSNTITIYGRAVDSILRFIRLDWGPFKPNALYFVESLVLPSGARIANARRPDQKPAIWWGYVDVQLSQSLNDAMLLKASTNAVSIEIFAPTPTAQLDTPKNLVRGATAFSQRADTVYFSFASRLLGDPNLRWLYSIGTILVIVYQLLKYILNRQLPEGLEVIGVEGEVMKKNVEPPPEEGTKSDQP